MTGLPDGRGSDTSGHDCSGVLSRRNVACIRQVVARPDCIGDLSERIGVLLPRVLPLVAFNLAREGVISKHVADPSGKIASSQISAGLCHVELVEDFDELTQRMGASCRCASAGSENEGAAIRHGHVHIFLPMANVRRQPFSDDKRSQFSASFLGHR